MKLTLNKKKIAECRKIAVKINKDVRQMIDAHSTVAIERSVLRLMGVSGAKEINKQFYPLANIVVDILQESGEISKGASYWMANACLHFKKSPAEIAEAVGEGVVDRELIQSKGVETSAEINRNEL